MGKNILILTGSPRKHGNSDMMADALNEKFAPLLIQLYCLLSIS